MLERIIPSVFGGFSGQASTSSLSPIREMRLQASDVGRPIQSAAGRLLTWQTTSAQYPVHSPGNLARLGYRRNSPLFSAVDRIAKSFAQGRFRVVDEMERPIPGHFLTGTIRRGGRYKPTPAASQTVLWFQLVQDYCLYGNVIWEIVPSRDGHLAEIWRLDPTRVSIKPGTQGPELYYYQVGGTYWPIQPSNIIHWLYPDTEQSWFGIPPALAAYRAAITDSELLDHLKITAQNLAVPAVVLKTDMVLDEPQAEEARSRWRDKLGGSNRGGVAIAHGGMSVEVVGLDMQKLDIGNLLAITESRIAMVLGVPNILLGRSGTQSDPTRANYEEAKTHFWLDTITPFQVTVADALSLHALPRSRDYVDGQRAEFGVEHVGVLQAEILKRAERAAELFAKGLVPRHTAQRLAGIPLQGPDVFYRPASVDGIVPADAMAETIDLDNLMSHG